MIRPVPESDGLMRAVEPAPGAIGARGGFEDTLSIASTQRAPTSRRRGETHPFAKLTAADVREAWRAAATGETQIAIAEW
jgi:hypothetical protein